MRGIICAKTGLGKAHYIDSFAGMMSSLRKIAVSCKPPLYQGRGLSKNKTARLDFEKKCGVHRFCSDTPCCVVKIDPHEKTRENGDFERFLRFFRP